MASIGTGLIFVVVALIPTCLFVQARQANRAIVSTEPRSTASLTDDVVAVSGTVEAGPAGVLTHLITGADALAVRWEVAEQNDTADETVGMDDSGRQTVPFRLVDDYGAVDVDPSEATIHLSTANSEAVIDAVRAPGEQAQTFIERVQENERRSHEAGIKQIHNTLINEATVHGVGEVDYRSRALQPGETGSVLAPARSDGDGTVDQHGRVLELRSFSWRWSPSSSRRRFSSSLKSNSNDRPSESPPRSPARSLERGCRQPASAPARTIPNSVEWSRNESKPVAGIVHYDRSKLLSGSHPTVDFAVDGSSQQKAGGGI